MSPLCAAGKDAVQIGEAAVIDAAVGIECDPVPLRELFSGAEIRAAC